eukprot:GDKJ01023154.1.p2 GENE.GDKJ01023154.1~~GDKJ01023154.1.p2  ORF type:complete len:126 (+),score=15.07 GDKJ01023154.1:1-378(+)
MSKFSTATDGKDKQEELADEFGSLHIGNHSDDDSADGEEQPLQRRHPLHALLPALPRRVHHAQDQVSAPCFRRRSISVVVRRVDEGLCWREALPVFCLCPVAELVSHPHCVTAALSCGRSVGRAA